MLAHHTASHHAIVSRHHVILSRHRVILSLSKDGHATTRADQ